MTDELILEKEADADVVLEGRLVCALTGQQRPATAQEETLQSFVEQLHREYGIPLEQFSRDVTVPCVSEEGGKLRSRKRSVSLAIFEGKGREVADVHNGLCGSIGAGGN
jgi:type I restriction enzyme M protein